MRKIETERLILRTTNYEDVEALQKCLSKPDISSAIYFMPQPYTENDAKGWVEKSLVGEQENTEWLFSALLKDTGTYIGSINLHKRDNEKSEIGYWLDPEYWGKGYASEMLSVVLEHAVNISNTRKVFATAALNNDSSTQLLQKYGFKKQGKTTASHEGVERISHYYELEF